MNVLSLFDGIACGRLALERAGVKVDRYIASEIDPHAIKCATTNYPDIEEIGDVTKINTANLPPIDLVIGGSPCQGFSSSGKRLNFDDPRSKLFFEFVRILNEVKPKYFLLENVKMQAAWCDIKGKCTLDRIDVNKGYSPDNCRWVDVKTQANNRRNNKVITYNGETHTVTEWAELCGINKCTLRSRLERYKWPIEQALTLQKLPKGVHLSDGQKGN